MVKIYRQMPFGTSFQSWNLQEMVFREVEEKTTDEQIRPARTSMLLSSL